MVPHSAFVMVSRHGDKEHETILLGAADAGWYPILTVDSLRNLALLQSQKALSAARVLVDPVGLNMGRYDIADTRAYDSLAVWGILHISQLQRISFASATTASLKGRGDVESIFTESQLTNFVYSPNKATSFIGLDPNMKDYSSVVVATTKAGWPEQRVKKVVGLTGIKGKQVIVTQDNGLAKELTHSLRFPAIYKYLPQSRDLFVNYGQLLANCLVLHLPEILTRSDKVLITRVLRLASLSFR